MKNEEPRPKGRGIPALRGRKAEVIQRATGKILDLPLRGTKVYVEYHAFDADAPRNDAASGEELNPKEITNELERKSHHQN